MFLKSEKKTRYWMAYNKNYISLLFLNGKSSGHLKTEWRKGWVTAKHKETFDGDGSVCFLDCGYFFIDVYICQNRLHCPL